MHAAFAGAPVTHRNRPMLEVDEAGFDLVFGVNVKSLHWMTLELAKKNIRSKRPVSPAFLTGRRPVMIGVRQRCADRA